MTIIVYRDGTMAADAASYLSNNGARIPGNTKKIYRLNDGSLFGAAGKSIDINSIRQWIESGQQGSLPKADATCIWIWQNRRQFVIDGAYVEEFDGPFFAVGSGAQAALGALWAGVSAEESVRIACLVDPYCDGEITILKLNERESHDAS